MTDLNFIFPQMEDLNDSNCRESSIRIHYPEFYDYLLNRYPDLKFTEKLYLFYHNEDKPHVCKVCGCKTKFLSYGRGYQEFCSQKCMNSCPDIQERKKQTCLKNYGVENPMDSEEVKSKLVNTCMERYGVENPFQSNKIMKKARQTCKEKYGTEYALQSEESKNKLKQTKKQKALEKYNNIISVSYDDNNYIYTMSCMDQNCDKCRSKTFEIPSNILYDRNRMGADICTNRSPIGAHIKDTKLERFVQDILKEHNIEYLTNNRKILKRKELDIYIPKKNIAIECNGVYWHSMVDSVYHYNKWKECKDNNIQLISIWEDWITNKSSIVKSIILSKLGIYDERIGASKCKFSEVSSQDARKFLDENHIQGFCSSTIRYGLFYKDELVALMCFKKSHNPSSKNNIGWELLRFCTKINTQIVGGAERLLSHFRENHQEPIISFASHDISNGGLYEKLGFQYVSEVKSCYWYVHNQTHKRFHRSSFTKKELVNKGYNPNLTEEQIMMSSDYFRIYDSGQSKYILL